MEYQKRRLYDEEGDLYLESFRDWTENNSKLVTWFLESMEKQMAAENGDEIAKLIVDKVILESKLKEAEKKIQQLKNNQHETLS